MGIALQPFSSQSVSASSIALALDLRRVGPGRWRGPCPKCGGDTRFSLDERDGKPLFKCWASCAQREIVDVLRRRGIWPERQQRTFTKDERRQYARARAEAAELAVLALDWYRGELAELNDRKRASVDFQTGRFDEAELAFAAHREHRLSQMSPADVLAEWRQQRRENPASTHRLERIGQTWRRTCESALRRAITTWSGGAQ